ncbi:MULTISPECIES: ABC-2 transporter permease [unclassified Lysinibacillus]|uniref:ABC-2 transporter permease n=1 Tax=unclassified Lysinibacillus TaxID=2636778 RepID=UPI0038087E41
MKMTGLVLTNFYMVYRSMIIYTVGAIVTGAVLFIYIGDEKFFGVDAEFFVPRIIFLLSILPAFEVLKVAAKSGYDKYVLTFPVRRGTIVKSQYIFLTLITVVGIMVALGALYLFSLLSWISLDIFLYQEVISMFTIFILTGSVTFPLIFMFGATKSDIFVLLTFFGSYYVAGLISKAMQYIASLMDIDLHNFNVFIGFSVIFVLIGMLIYILSYYFSVTINNKKEF